jgi:integrase
MRLGAITEAPSPPDNRYDGMWVLAATTGMRRSELAGGERKGVDLENRVLMIEDPRVVVTAQAQASMASRRRVSGRSRSTPSPSSTRAIRTMTT